MSDLQTIDANQGASLLAIIERVATSTVTVTAELKHRDGHRESTAVTLPLDNGGLKGKHRKAGV